MVGTIGTEGLVATIVGTGYVGLGYAAGFTKSGIKVNCVDLNETIVRSLNEGKSPIDEPGIQAALQSARNRGLVRATTDIGEVAGETDAFFICVGTYCDAEGNIDLSQVRGAARSIGSVLQDDGRYRVVCVKSTVIPGTTDGVVAPILEETSGMRAGRDFGLCMSPEFLREGNALEDITKPDKVVIGGLDQRSTDALKPFFAQFEVAGGSPPVETDLRTAELIKYAQNSFLAVKISFINEIATISEKFGVNVGDVAVAIGMDKRISPLFLNAGAGFGGSCFPKDVQALVSAARKAGVDAVLLAAALERNRLQKRHVVDLLEAHADISGEVVAVLGLAFKPNTGDTRESVALTVIDLLLEKGAGKVVTYDPSEFAMREVREAHGESISYAGSVGDCLRGARAALVLTEWDEFRELEPDDFLTHMAPNPVVIDARRLYDVEKFEDAGVEIAVLGQSRDHSFRPD
ncbi:MAG: UDP-glucose dehydrogenase family protein [Promethearchaeota archaeon]